ncbi:MAG: haloacid dehalogenase-like hydrolase, partial [Clostridia bacterium]|nr:haloacid dehalogenase-like hydrolase [Clostridia bacterium]
NVYDFDNTIYDGENTLDLFFYYIKKHPWLLRQLPAVLKAFRRYRRGEVTIEEMIEKYVPLVEKDALRVFDFENDPAEFWDKHMKKIKPFYKKQQRDDDLIITASPDFNMEEICSRLGIRRYLTSTIDRETGKIGKICIRKNKIKYFFEEYGGETIDNFYTDSIKNDLPLIEAAKHAFVVKGNKITQIK